jgi:tRNA(Ile)-lysidine synthase
VRAREGGESVRLFRDRPRRALKAWLQEAGIPHWERDTLPLVFCDDALAVVPGLGVATEFAAGPASAGIRIQWEPNERQGPTAMKACGNKPEGQIDAVSVHKAAPWSID